VVAAGRREVSGCSAFVSVVKAADLWNGDDDTVCHDRT
jgi:hypothetical protein